MFWPNKIGKGGREPTAGPLARLKATQDNRLQGAEMIMSMRAAPQSSNYVTRGSMYDAKGSTALTGGSATAQKIEGLRVKPLVKIDPKNMEHKK